MSVVLGSAAGLLTCESSSGYLPGFCSQWLLPFVVAYSGGSVGESFKFHIKAPASLARLRLPDVLRVRLCRRGPRRLAFILDLKLEVHPSSLSSPFGHR